VGIGDPIITVEYTIWRKGEGPYHLERDGKQIWEGTPLTAAHKVAQLDARKEGHKLAGLTEQFGRNKQYVMGRRGGWCVWKGDA